MTNKLAATKKDKYVVDFVSPDITAKNTERINVKNLGCMTKRREKAIAEIVKKSAVVSIINDLDQYR